ncbi:hypothetical protein BVC71_08970 [Marivivens niveibacter]|uniref:DUF1800 domain-containing protein n=1 Tax=Marivivens niveibacter TaxID=1930667 RepID=A0A251WXR4_9RHOB|nr:DUF1800 domain-containing protein [Marivivens niveibacter]OUD08844.1 hypothetical protein BVC71_08970 [Marivivens niveibacter]
MRTQAEIAQIRYGLGLSPHVRSPTVPNDMLDRLTRFDADAVRFPIPLFDAAHPTLLEQRLMRRERSAAGQSGDPIAIAEVQERYQAQRKARRDAEWLHFRTNLARGAWGEDAFRERLARFWGDHFTVASRVHESSHLVAPYIETAIRPNMTGLFADLLWAAVTHPMMIGYLDQGRSYGPNSVLGLRRGLGLNENLARELLELHTLGIDGSYDQDDVRELAELLTGLTYRPDRGLYFDAGRAEPGSETVLGRTYMAVADMSVLRAAVDDIAAHPDTAFHIARKLVVHFISDEPDTALVAALAARFAETGGDLMAVYDALLSNAAAWEPLAMKVKQPMGFVTSTFRALGTDVERFFDARHTHIKNGIYVPMQTMGQEWEHPISPEGWPEEAEAWVTPQGMAGRINWAMTAPERWVDELPDPREFVVAALGNGADAELRFAAHAAESVRDGVGIVLASAAFQRR